MVRSVADRDALAVGVRVQLSWVKHAPYTQRADLAVADRIAVVRARDGDAWIALDDAGEQHRLADADLEVAQSDPAAGRWRIEGAIPAYRMGERLQLHWRHRSPGRAPDPPRGDCSATVIAEQPSIVTLRLDDGSEIEMFRWGAQADERDRQAPRWFVIARAG